MGSFALATLTIDRSELRLVKETKELLKELLETLDIMADKRLLRDIEISRSQAQASKGHIRSFRRLMAELGMSSAAENRSWSGRLTALS